jgi:sialic acid synthase SpsE
VEKIREAEMILGNGIKKPFESEEKIKIIVRKSIVADTDIEKGEKITENMLAIKRPGTGISPKYFD